MSYYDEVVEAFRPVVPGHEWADLTRYSRGRTPIRPQRPVYGWRWTCECGETRRTNEQKRPAIQSWRDHRLGALSKESK